MSAFSPTPTPRSSTQRPRPFIVVYPQAVSSVPAIRAKRRHTAELVHQPLERWALNPGAAARNRPILNPMCPWPAPTDEDLDESRASLDELAQRFDGDRYWGNRETLNKVEERVRWLQRERRLAEAQTPELRSALFLLQGRCQIAGEQLTSIPARHILTELKLRTASPSSGDVAIFDAMWDGIQRNERLLAMTYARVAPEATVVATAVDGLTSQSAPTWNVRMEATHNGVSRIDLVVAPSGSTGNAVAVEFKTLWSNGQRECVDRIREDLSKLRGVNGYAAVLAYAVYEGAEASRSTDQPLNECVLEAEKSIGRAWWRSNLASFDQRSVRGEHQLVVWRVA